MAAVAAAGPGERILKPMPRTVQTDTSLAEVVVVNQSYMMGTPMMDSGTSVAAVEEDFVRIVAAAAGEVARRIVELAARYNSSEAVVAAAAEEALVRDSFQRKTGDSGC